MRNDGKKGTIRWISLMMLPVSYCWYCLRQLAICTICKRTRPSVKDVRVVLADVNRDVVDSMLFKKLVSPSINEAERIIKYSSRKERDTLIGRNNINTHVAWVISTDSTDQHPSGFEKELRHIEIKRPGFGSDRDCVFINVHRTMTDTNTIGSGETAFIKSALPMLIKEVMIKAGGLPGSADTLWLRDTVLVRKAFDKKANNNHWEFEVEWNIGNADSNKGLVIDNTYLNRTTSIRLRDYQAGVVKKILPQTAFAGILILLTGSSFLFAYRSLKKQMMLTAMKNDFISNMSHELKTPIATVKVAVEALQNFNGLENPQTTRDYLQIAGMEINRLDMLVNKTLNASMLEAGRIVLQREQTDVQHLMADTLQLLKHRFVQADAKVEIEFNAGDYNAPVDKMHIQGVFINILDNALKYSDKKPVISVTASSSENYIIINIADNGPGIREEYQKRIFDKFFRVPAGDTHNVKGYGLGLNYARQIMILHGGNISMHNREKGGCVFTIMIPKA